MPTAHSWPDRAELSRAIADVGHLLWFRRATVRRPRAVAVAVMVMIGVTVAAATLPALVREPHGLGRFVQPALVAIVLVSVGSAVASGGGREVLARDPAAIHPIAPLTDHLGALLLAPLSAGWLIQTWGLLGLVAVVAGPSAQVVTVAWVSAATALAQLLGLLAEWLRRGRRAWIVLRVVVPMVVAGLLGAAPARLVAEVVLGGGWGDRAATTGVLFVAAVVFVAVGGLLAQTVARRPVLDEGRLETRAHRPRRTPDSDLALLRRIDRSSVWRSLPLRRGTMLLAFAPGTIALAGAAPWATLIMLPGLVASGCVLLFGVNLWCLDGRGMLWRESLPVGPRTVLAARGQVLVELLLAAGTATVVLGGLRAGRPSVAELSAVVLALLVVVGQSLSAALRWSAAHPYAVDLRSARATPAPPLAMVGYSLRLALATTLSGLLLAGFAGVGRLDLVVATAGVLLVVSAIRVTKAAGRWADPVRRAEIVAVVSAG